MSAVATRPSAAARLVRYELVRMRSLRSTWVLLLLALFASAMSVVSARSLLSAGPSAVETVSASFVLGVVTTAPEGILSVLAGVVGAMAIGHEFRYGTVQVTAVQFPRRLTLLLVKLAMAVAVCVTVGLAVVGLGMGLVMLDYSWAEIGGGSQSAVSQFGLLARLAVVLAGYTAIGFCVAALTRSLQVGIALPLLWSNVLEPVLLLTGAASNGPLRYLLPYRNGRDALTGDVGEMLPLGTVLDPWFSLLLFAGQIAVVVALTAWAFRRSDL